MYTIRVLFGNQLAYVLTEGLSGSTFPLGMNDIHSPKLRGSVKIP